MSEEEKPARGVTEEIFHTVTRHCRVASDVESKINQAPADPHGMDVSAPEALLHAQRIIEEQNANLLLLAGIVKRQGRAITECTNTVNAVLRGHRYPARTAERIRGVKVSLLEGLNAQVAEDNPGVVVQLPNRVTRLMLAKNRPPEPER